MKSYIVHGGIGMIKCYSEINRVVIHIEVGIENYKDGNMESASVADKTMYHCDFNIVESRNCVPHSTFIYGIEFETLEEAREAPVIATEMQEAFREFYEDAEKDRLRREWNQGQYDSLEERYVAHKNGTKVLPDIDLGLLESDMERHQERVDTLSVR